MTRSDSGPAPSVSRLRCGTENDTCTFSMLPNVPRQAFSRMLPTSVMTSRADASIAAAAPARSSAAP